MICGLIVIFGLLAMANAGLILGPGSTTVAVAQPTPTVLRTENYESHPQYSFSYSVADGLTGDNKAQEETRNGDVVQGSYSLVEPDGSRRTVSYAADPINGFNAVVQKDPRITVKAHTVSANPASVTSSPGHVLRPGTVQAERPKQLLTARQPSFLSTAGDANLLRQSTLIASQSPYLTNGNVITGYNTELVSNIPVSVGLGLGVRGPASLYSTEPIIEGYAYGNSGPLVNVQ